MPTLTTPDRVELYRLITEAYPIPYPIENSPVAALLEVNRHRRALQATVQRMAADSDTGPLVLHVGENGPAPTIESVPAPKPATSHVNANQPGYQAPAGADPFALGAL